MFRSMPLFVALRYFHAKGSERFASVASLIAIGGIALAVTALVTVLSVVNGFEEQLRSRVLGMVHHVTLFPTQSSLHGWQALARDVSAHPNVIGAAPFVELKGIVQGAEGMVGVVMQGIEPRAESAISVLPQQVVLGRYEDLATRPDALMVGEHLAERLNVKLGDRVVIALPFTDPNDPAAQAAPRSGSFAITAIYRSGTLLDQTHVFLNLHTAAGLGGLEPDAVTGLHAKLRDAFASQRTMEELYAKLPQDFHLRDWSADYGGLFKHVAASKRLVFLSVSIILAVACFNILSVLLVTVHSRVEDIAILRTMGATQRLIVLLFVMQGALIALTGIVAGGLAGLGLSLSLDRIFGWAERLTGSRLLSLDTYIVGYLAPSVQWADVAGISALALGLSVAASFYPAWRASRTDPAEIL
jgi:lipoprotein-releasing system permease protein